MGGIRIGADTRIDGVLDATLDRVRALLEDPPTPGGGFWLAGPYELYRNDERVLPDPSHGHQRLWVSTSQQVSLWYDRPLHDDPDVVAEDETTVYIG
ncbi:hypothetical protein [Ruania halotolerans]|uniref:hypothetical protein n=1 Tax=Ruania halotolerans TaxID=2897773 RepID=UPI001E46F273|nr:hypothetical protein [Ruania halotolerans]UFU05497.1 hypothetical protein LQF10_13715 [Ruania halotolerans]